MLYVIETGVDILVSALCDDECDLLDPVAGRTASSFPMAAYPDGPRASRAR